MKKIAWLCLVMVGLVSCGSPSKKSITVKGSDTMVLIGQRWAEKYMSLFPKEIIQVNGGGSGTGFAALLNGSTDICQASRPIKAEESQKIKEKANAEVVEIPVAKDGITIYVHPDNPMQAITLDELAGIYTGKIKNWKELGGADSPIVIYGRENSSGTYEFFKEHVLNKADFAANVQTLPGTAAIASAVSQDKSSIGYGGATYAKGIKVLPVKVTADGEVIVPSEENVVSGKYPISRNLYFYLSRTPNEREKKFIDWVLSNEGQQLAVSEGYFPVKAAN